MEIFPARLNKLVSQTVDKGTEIIYNFNELITPSISEHQMDYLERLDKAIEFIESKLDEDIRIEEIAKVTGYSYYHFHRVFMVVVGESIGSYVRKRRLTKAAQDLLHTDKRILDIAIEYQFESQEAFNRAFKKLYQVSPGVTAVTGSINFWERRSR